MVAGTPINQQYSVCAFTDIIVRLNVEDTFRNSKLCFIPLKNQRCVMKVSLTTDTLVLSIQFNG